MAIIGHIHFVIIDVNYKSLYTTAEPSFVYTTGKVDRGIDSPDRDADRMISELVRILPLLGHRVRFLVGYLIEEQVKK